MHLVCGQDIHILRDKDKKLFLRGFLKDLAKLCILQCAAYPVPNCCPRLVHINTFLVKTVYRQLKLQARLGQSPDAYIGRPHASQALPQDGPFDFVPLGRSPQTDAILLLPPVKPPLVQNRQSQKLACPPHLPQHFRGDSLSLHQDELRRHAGGHTGANAAEPIKERFTQHRGMHWSSLQPTRPKALRLRNHSKFVPPQAGPNFPRLSPIDDHLRCLDASGHPHLD